MVKARFCSEFSAYCTAGTTLVKEAINSKGASVDTQNRPLIDT